jgi:transcriptional regulator with XRE-family HTH domain
VIVFVNIIQIGIKIQYKKEIFMDPHEKIAGRIREFAKVNYRSLDAFAKACGMKAQNLSKYTADGRMPGLEVLQRFQEAGMSLDWLANGAGIMWADNECGRDLYKKIQGATLPKDKAISYEALSKDEALRQVQKIIQAIE